MNQKQKLTQKYPVGWDERRVRDLIAHYDNQTEEERTAEIEEKAIADGWHRVEDAIKEFNKTNRSKIRKAAKLENGRCEEAAEFCLLNWCGEDEDGPFNEYFEISMATQLPAMDQPFRPVLCTIFKRLKPAVELPGSKRKLAGILNACVDGVKLEVKRAATTRITAVSTTVYPKRVDAESLSDALIRLEHSVHNLRAALRTRKSRA